MDELEQYIKLMLEAGVLKIIISKQASKAEEYKKIVVDRKETGFQIVKYTEKQAFHENVSEEDIVKRCAKLTDGHFRQVNGMSVNEEHMIMISKKGAATYKVKKKAVDTVLLKNNKGNHNRKKNYILEEGMKIDPLVDMGVFTKDGKVVNSMYDKYKQINRFVEIIDDEIDCLPKDQTITVIDFGCGKSYLTFAMYHYLKVMKGFDIRVIGLDLKEDVIAYCNELKEKYGYDKMSFTTGDIASYTGVDAVDMVVTLHACDTATDYALEKAVKWGASVILSVPCCQHELNYQMKNEALSAVLKYGLLKERIAALITDGLRAEMLEQWGYDTQVLEFIDMEHTPKNILIRGVKRNKSREADFAKYDQCCRTLHVDPTIGKLLRKEK